MLFEPFPGDIRQQTRAFKRGVITELDLKGSTFSTFICALEEDPHDTQRIIDEFERIPEFVQVHFEKILRRLPCEGDYWDWPPGGVLANPGGVVAWQKPRPETQEAIATLRRCVVEFWAARGQVRNVAANSSYEYEMRIGTIEDLRQTMVIWDKVGWSSEKILGEMLDCFTEDQIELDWSRCSESIRGRVIRLLTEYRPATIRQNYLGPPKPRLQQRRERTYLALLQFLGLQPSADWAESRAAND